MKKISRLRLAVQTLFFVLVAGTALNHTLEEAGMRIPFFSDASVHVLCPFGAIVSFYNLAVTGSFVNKIHASAMVIFSATLFLSVILGPVFCGWICPFGTVQEWFASLGRRLKTLNRFQVPAAIHSKLRLIRYAVLVWAIYVTARSGQLIFADYDPYYALFNFWSGEVALSALVILGITLLASLFIERPWCKYACPLGALLGLTNRLRLFSPVRQKNTCISCRQCDHACPMNIQVSASEKVRDTACISCLKCTSESACPVPETVMIQMGGARRDA